MTPDLLCPACEHGDHEHAELCEADYKCSCACHVAAFFNAAAAAVATMEVA